MLIRPSGLTPARRPAFLATASSALIGASLLFLMVAAAGYREHTRTESNVAQIPADLSDRTSYSSSDQDLLKARIGFARRIGI